MATTVEQFGNAFDGTASLSGYFGVGGVAVPGDILMLVAVGGAGALDLPAVSDNVGAGWTKVDDRSAGAGSSEIRATWWTKIAVGGEDTAEVDWAGAGDVAFAGAILRTPSFPAPYIIGAGLLVWDAGLSQMRFTAGNPTGNGQTYIALAATGTTNVAANGIVSPPGQTSSIAQQDGVGAFCDANDSEGSHTTANLLRYRVTPRMDDNALVAIFGISEDPGAISGTGELLLGGTGDLSVDPPTQGLQATGRFMGGRALLSARSPFPQPVRIPEDHLGCGVYQCFAFTRGLGEIVTMLPFTQIDWGRILDETSDATLTIDGVANPRAFARCCAALSELEPEEHELAIYRNGWRVWSGPITDMTFPAEQCVIQASDLSWWLQNRTIHANINSVQIDLVNILVAYVQDAMSVDNSAGLQATVLALAGQLGDRLVQQADHQMAADVIAELSRTGVDWTTIDRQMLLGPLQPQPAPYPGATPYPTLIDANFRIQPTILVSGSQGANTWYVNGPPNGDGDLIFGEYGPHFPATPDHVEQPAAPDYAEIETQYGRIEKVVTESRILDQPGIDFNAQTRYDLLKRPLVYISDGALLPSTPIPMEKLLPGSLVNVHLSNVCRVIGEPYRLKAVQVSAHSDGSEDVDVQWQPLGTGETL